MLYLMQKGNALVDYYYEKLGDEDFQRLCQSLLVKDQPNVQCFPVGQPDGGRDAIAYSDQKGQSREYVVYQVKFVRNPNGVTDPHKWLLETLKAELPKIKKLVPTGAVKYYVMTNVSGTAHLDAGAIDQAQRMISQYITDETGVPGQCLWRDDLNRRLDNAWDLKWAYPNVMTGSDVLRYILEHGLSEQHERRLAAIKAYVLDQYERDQEVKFKQVDLQNDLFDLFVDVPLSMKSPSMESHVRFFGPSPVADGTEVDSEDTDDMDNSYVGAAATLLDPVFQSVFSQVVLEGGPGQGKSTLAQFICQVYRLKLVGAAARRSKLAPQHQPANLRIPLKVDLRDLSAWLQGKNPFARDGSSPEGPTTLETFLAAQIQRYSGGLNFDVADLLAVAKVSALLLVLDGLDEVADITHRSELVKEVELAVGRLRANAASLQVIVTSRPSAFLNSPGFSATKFPHLVLETLTLAHIAQYADRWIKNKRLSESDGNLVTDVLALKLNQPHIRDLSKNPMQLAILLTLIHTKGPALPDQRTAMYDSYVERFFDREAEKDEMVRSHRPLLMDVHRYLGWILHSGAEVGANNGIINKTNLVTILGDYLESEERSKALAASLFQTVTERLVFLVSRVEGTFEFEVQPLREYFAARHLYETIPYSPVGQTLPGTLPERLESISKNFYWLNVTRFFAGCLDKGELPALLFGAKGLLDEGDYGLVSYPYDLIAMFLSDYVFEEAPKVKKEAIRFLLDGLRSNRLMVRSHPSTFSLSLPPGAGVDELISSTTDLLLNHDLAADWYIDRAALLWMNMPKNKLYSLWSQTLTIIDANRVPEWLQVGSAFDCLEVASESDLRILIEKAGNRLSEVLSYFLRENRADIIERDDVLSTATVMGILDGSLVVGTYDDSVLTRFAYVLGYGRLWNLSVAAAPRGTLLSQVEFQPPVSIGSQATGVLAQCASVITTFLKEGAVAATVWAENVQPLHAFVEQIRDNFGEHWRPFLLAVGTIGVPPVAPDKLDLLAHDQPLCRRVQALRYTVESKEWWLRQYSLRKTPLDSMMLCFAFAAFAPSDLLLELAVHFQPMVDALTPQEWKRVIAPLRHPALSELRMHAFGKEFPKTGLKHIQKDLNVRMVLTLSEAGRLLQRTDRVVQKRYTEYRGDDTSVLEVILRASLRGLWRRDTSADTLLETIRYSYSRVRNIRSFPLMEKQLPSPMAAAVLKCPADFPRRLVQAANESLKAQVSTQGVPLAQLAKDGCWFE